MSDVLKRQQQGVQQVNPAQLESYRKQQQQQQQQQYTQEALQTEQQTLTLEQQRDQAEFIKNNIKLDTGEWINKEEYEKLNADDKKTINSIGVEAFSKRSAEQYTTFKNNNTKLNTGEWIPNTLYNSLNQSDQQLIMSLGTEGYNRKKQDDYNQQVASIEAERQQILSQYERLDSGEYVDKIAFGKMTSEQQTKLQALGTIGYNQWAEQQYQQQIQELEQNYKQLNSGEWVDKEYYNNLPDDWKTRLNSIGTAGWKQFWDSNPYRGSSDFIIVDNQIYGKTDNPQIGIDYSGMNVWLGDRWPDSVKYPPGVAKPASSPGTTTPVDEIPKTETQSVELPSTPSAGSPLSGTTYTGLPSVLGGTWGKTLTTLAVAKFSGIELTTDQEKYISNLSGKNLQAYNAEIMALRNAPGTTVNEKILARQESALAPEKLIVSKIINPEIEKVTTITAIDTELISSKAMTVSEKEAMETLNKQYKIEGGYNIAAYLKDNPNDISKLSNIGFGNDDIKNALDLNDTQAQIATIEQKQKQIDSKSFIDKIKNVFDTRASVSEIAREVLSVGAVKTAAFDSEDIDLEYLKAKEAALAKGANLQISQDEYRDQVLEKQQTATDLAMGFVPFEYIRPGRWDEMHLWEKVAYPVLDVFMLVPGVGLATKGVGSIAKTASTGAKIAAAGGKSAVEFAAKDAIQQLAKAQVKVAAQRALLGATKEAAKKTTDKITKQVLSGAIKAGEKDIALADKQLASVARNTEALQQLAIDAVTYEGKAGGATYKAISGIEKKAFATAKKTEIPTNIMASGIISTATIENWNELTPGQRGLGIAMSILPLGIHGKVLNMAENILDPYKIPKAAVVPRVTNSKPVVGEIFNPTGDNTLRFAFSTADKISDSEYKQARNTVASLMKQATSGEKTAVATYKGKEVKLRGTGFQETVGASAFSGTPMGEIFKEGTGAFGTKTNMEKYLSKVNAKLPESKRISIESKPYLALDEDGNAIKTTVSTVVTPDVTIKGSEGGEYLGAGLHTRFTKKSASGQEGKIRAGIIVSFDNIDKLPDKLTKFTMDNGKLREKAIEWFDGSRNTNQVVEGFKKFGRIMELEDVATNGSIQMRSRNLRSQLADKLHLGRGEYYTRDKDGRIELFQMYLLGGRETPYTLKELYQLKGNALKNSLEDIYYGIELKLKSIGKKKAKTVDMAKEEQIKMSFEQVDDALRRNKIDIVEAMKTKRKILQEFRESRPTYNKETIRRSIATESERYRTSSHDKQHRGILQYESREPIRSDNRTYRFIPDTRIMREQNSRRQEQQSRPEIRTNQDRIARETSRIEESSRITRAEQTRQPIREEPRIFRSTEEQRAKIPRTDVPRTVISRTDVPRTDIPRTIIPRAKLINVPKKININPPPLSSDNQQKWNKLTQKQIEGVISWKQGLFYIMRYPPFNQDDVIYSRNPFPGVKYYDGIGSAVKSTVALYGDIPKALSFDMGIVDTQFFRTSNKAKPRLVFRPDPKQKTRHAGVIKPR